MNENALASYNAIFDALPTLSSFSGDGKWLSIARAKQWPHVKVVTPQHVCNIQSYISQFIKANGPCAMYPLIFGGFHYGFSFRSLNDKNFIVLAYSPLYIYSSLRATMETMPGCAISYGVPLVFSEGLLDAESLSEIYPLSFAYLTNHISEYQAQFISMFTNKVIIVPDNDQAGKLGYNKSACILNKYGVSVSKIEIPMSYKDPGDILLEALKEENNVARETYDVIAHGLDLITQ